MPTDTHGQRPVPYGEWPSPISAEAVASGSTQLLDPFIVGDEVWWSEMRPQEGGRRVVVRSGPEGAEDLLPAPWSAHTQVHEYGGASWHPVPTERGPGFVFTHRDDQRVHLKLLTDPEPVPLTPPTEATDRYADFAPTPDGAGVVCVRERHDADGRVRRALVAVALDGSGVRELVTDGDFLAAPSYSPDGRRLAWIRWNHPAMPWDATELRVADLGPDGAPGEPRTLLGGPAESVLQPTWVAADRLYALSDRSGWWNLHEVPADGGAVRPLCPREAEFGGPMWLIGSRWYAVLGDGRVAVRSGLGEARLGVLDPTSGELTDLALPYRSFGAQFHHAGGLRASGSRFVAIAGESTSPTALVLVDADTREARTVRSTGSVDGVAPWLPEGVAVTLDSPGGALHGIAYAPRNPDCRGPEGARPPYLVNVHGGPTAHAQPVLDLAVAYFTSRGIGWFELNYRGSSGYGRAYREALDGRWGVTDVEDALACIGPLADQLGADPERIVVTGKSAGGATTLAALVTSDAFAAGISEFGVGDLAALARDTHDFESRYLDGLVGAYPEEAATYAERSALTHVGDLGSPILLLQGEEDAVVPPDQARSFAAAAAERGLPHELVLYEGEGHGWTRAETIVSATETKLRFLGKVLGFAPRT